MQFSNYNDKNNLSCPLVKQALGNYVDIKKYKDLNLPSYHGYKHLMEVQIFLNDELFNLFVSLQDEDEENVSRSLIAKVESLTDHLNEFGYNLHRSSYGGATTYENSEQSYSNKNLSINFHGFSAQITWDKL